MKRILLVCCLFAASGTIAFAQEAQPQAKAASPYARPTISKKDYTAGVTQLYTITAQGKKDEAQAKWDEVHNMIRSSFGVIKYKIKDATEANNETEKARLYQVLRKQQTVYTEIIKLRTDLVANRQPMNEKLVEFGTGIVE